MNRDKRLPTYVLITAARNEAQYIVKTLDSVINQTILPLRWVIVNDGSIDETAAIVKEYAAQYPFIKLVTIQRDGDRNFAAKVYAFEKGQQLMQDLQYDFIGNLDADVSFQKDYYEILLNTFKKNPKLGVIGGILFDNMKGKFHKQPANPQSVGGPIQFFRKICYEEIDGYIPLKNGMEDGVAEIMARQKGWVTKSFPELKVLHHRREGTAKQSILKMRFNTGVNQYQLGYLIIYQALRSTLHFKVRPYIIGGYLMFAGYIYAWACRKPRIVSNKFVDYLRYEQKQLLYSRIKKLVKTNGTELVEQP